jgi:Na+/melibiose symporter-like transporter
VEKVRKIAVFCTARAVFLGSVAIYVVMMFFSSDPAFAFRAGAILTVIMAGVLAWKSWFILRQEPSSTEIWIYLDYASRPRSDHDKRAFAETLRRVYGRFGQHALVAACIMFAISTGLLAVGGEPVGEVLHAEAH